MFITTYVRQHSSFVTIRCVHRQFRFVFIAFNNLLLYDTFDKHLLARILTLIYKDVLRKYIGDYKV